MNKKAKIFLNVLYYIFTFGLGILLALVLPGLLMTSNLPNHIEEYINEDPTNAKAINLLVGYDDIRVAKHQRFDDGSGIVLFRTMIIEDETGENKTQPDKVYLAYSGFLYGTNGNYNTYERLPNLTSLVINDNIKLPLLNYDSDNDGKFDNVMSLVKNNYVFFSIKKTDTEQIHKIKFVDSFGNTYKECSIELDFNHKFFTDLTEFVDAYNANSKDERLKELENNFLNTLDENGNKSYQKCDTSEEVSIANRDGALLILLYFAVIYIIGDFIGMRFILKGIMFLVRKIKKQKKEPQLTDGIYGTDYYTQLEIKVEFDVCDGSNITINYHNETDEINMIFTKANNYTVKERVHAGTYLNAYLESPGYNAIDMPTTLIVKGFQMKLVINLKKID